MDREKMPLIIVKPPKPMWVQEILKNSDKMQKEYDERIWKRILHAAFGDK